MAVEPSPARSVDLGASDASASRRSAAPRSLGTIFFDTLERRIEAAVIVAVLLVGLGYWAHRGVDASLRTIRATALLSVLETKATALQLWIDSSRTDAELWAVNPEARDAITRLVSMASSGASAGDLARAPERARLTALLSSPLSAGAPHVYEIVDRDGRIVAGTAVTYLARRLAAESRADLEAVWRGDARLLAVRPERHRLADPPHSTLPRAVAWFSAPVRGQSGEPIAALSLGWFADTRFAAILANARFETTGEAYAFDRDGLMLSDSRFTERLRELDLIPGAAAGAALALILHTPGAKPGDGIGGSQPLTRLVERAVSARSATNASDREGVLLEPYPNYIGVESIGAWRWMPDYGIGLAVEMSAEEAYAPLRYLTTVYWVIFSLLLFAVAVAIAFSLFAVRLKREVRQLGHYRLEALIGEGGTARVYRAMHGLLKRPTAVKILKPHATSEEIVTRFEREVQLASRLEHPSTIEIYDYGRTRDGTFFCAMEYLEGVTLGELIEKDGPQPPARVAHILKRVSESLREAHDKGLVHRDIKPQNIMLCERGGEFDVVKVLDFGLAKDLQAPDPRSITQYARVLGTPLYMAPERIRDPADADARSDIYAVGVVAFELLTGRRLFQALNDLALQRMVVEQVPPRASAVAGQPIPPELDALISRCLAKDRAERPQTIDELIDVFDSVLSRQPWRTSDARRWWQDHHATRMTPA